MPPQVFAKISRLSICVYEQTKLLEGAKQFAYLIRSNAEEPKMEN